MSSPRQHTSTLAQDKRTGRPFTIGDILAALIEDDLAGERTHQAVANRLVTPTRAPAHSARSGVLRKGASQSAAQIHVSSA